MNGRQFVFVVVASLASVALVMGTIELTHPGLLEHRSFGVEVMLTFAAGALGWIVGWGCGR